jgi:hypothetical protein
MACAGAFVASITMPALADPVGAHPSVTDYGAAPVVVRPVEPEAPVRPAHRGLKRVPIYGSSFPGPNAVRQCEAHYEQEFRVAGTVIVPRMHCWWVPG